jgi:hypothetical protein
LSRLIIKIPNESAFTLITGTTIIQQCVLSATDQTYKQTIRQAPIATSDNNAYLAWWRNNKTGNGNDEVMFKASTDGGKHLGTR